MTLTIHTEEDSQRQLIVQVEVPETQVQSQMRRTARKLSSQLHIPGFRRGKVPYNILARRLGENNLRAEAVEEMLESVLAEALEEIDAVAYRQPTLDDMQIEPLVLNITIPLEPTVDLGDYRAIRMEVEPVEVTDEALEESLDHIRTHHQELETVDRPVELGDLVTASGEARLVGDEDEVIWRVESAGILMDAEKTFPGLHFVEEMLGTVTGEDKEMTLAFPDDYDDDELVGKEALFQVTVEQVQSRHVPELTDELAQQEGDYQTVEELRDAVRKRLLDEAEAQAGSQLLDDLVDEILEDAEIVFPPAAVESELDSMIENLQEQVARTGMKWEDYLTLEGKDDGQLREELEEQATDRVRRGLVLRQFVAEERLEVASEEIDSAVEERLDRFGDDEGLREQLRTIFTQGEGLTMMSSDILLDKVKERVREIVTGNAPDLPALEDESDSGDEEE